METDILQYLPEWFAKLTDYQQLMATEQVEIAELAKQMQLVQDNLYAQTAQESTIADWEQVFAITANPIQEDLPFRRARILNRLASNPPFTLPFLYQKLDELIGVGKWHITIDYASYTIYIEALAEGQNWSQEITVTLGTIKPCHIVFINRPVRRDMLHTNEEIRCWQGALCCQLGTWKIGTVPFLIKTGQEDTLIMPGQNSLQAALCQVVADKTAQAVAAVRVNGTAQITAFDTRQAQDGNAVLRYTVTPETTDCVTDLELLNAQEEILSKVRVYVPITATTQFEHRIAVQNE